MPVGRDRAFLLTVGMDQRLLRGVLVKALLHLRVEAVAVRDGGVRRLVTGKNRAHLVAVHHQQGVVGFEFDLVALVCAQREGLSHQSFRLFVSAVVVLRVARCIEQARHALGVCESLLIFVAAGEFTR